MKAHQWSRRTFYLAAVVAIVASTSGFALASVLSPPTTTPQGANFYDGTNVGVTGYTSAALSVAQTPDPTLACSSGTVVDTTTGQTAVLTISAYSGATNCSSNDFAEEFVLGYVTTGSASQVDNFTVYTQLGAGAIQSNSAHLDIGGSGTFTATVEVFVDYGHLPPAAGITVLELVLHH